MLDLGYIDQVVKLSKKHTNKIYQGMDGYWYTYVDGESGRRKVKKKDRASLDSFLLHYYEEKEVTIKDAFDEWNERRLALGKIKNATFTRNEQIFKRHFSGFEDKGLGSVTAEDFSDFLEEQTEGLNQRAFTNLKSICRGFLKRAKKRHLIDWSVDSMLSDLDVSDREFASVRKSDSDEIFYDDEMDEILLYCFENRDDICCIGVALMFATGMRVGEVVALKKTDILGLTISVSKTETRYREDDHMVFEVSERPKTEAGIRTVIVPKKHAWIVDAMVKSTGDYIFIGKNGNRLHTQAIRKRMYQICRKLSIKVRSPHKARKTYGSILLDSGVDSKIIEKQMGHTSITCTEHYYHRDRHTMEEKRAAIENVSQFLST